MPPSAPRRLNGGRNELRLRAMFITPLDAITFPTISHDSNPAGLVHGPQNIWALLYLYANLFNPAGNLHVSKTSVSDRHWPLLDRRSELTPPLAILVHCSISRLDSSLSPHFGKTPLASFRLKKPRGDDWGPSLLAPQDPWGISWPSTSSPSLLIPTPNSHPRPSLRTVSSRRKYVVNIAW